MNIKNMLSFLDEKEIEGLADKIIENNLEPLEGIALEELLPFLDEKYIDDIYIKLLEKGKDETIFLPFLSEECLKDIIDKYIKGELHISINNFLPFLDEDEIDKLFILSSEKKIDLNATSLLPFCKEETIDKFFLDLVKKCGDFKEYLPFVSNEVLHNLALKYIEGNNNIPIDDLYPFMDKDDISLIFKHVLKK